ncbi:hypothetical protein D3C76_1472960 [compost metagenome]
MNILDVALDQAANDPLQVLIFLRKRNVVHHLLHGITQPRGWDVSGDNKGRTIVHQFCCRFNCIGKTIFE